MCASEPKSRKKLVFILVTFTIGIFVGLLLAEVALRMAGPVWLRKYMKGTNLEGELRYGSDAGWPIDSVDGKFIRFKPDTEFLVDYYEYKTTIHTDRWGGRSIPDRKELNKFSWVPVLGDSFAFGLGVKDEETFLNLISKNSQSSYLNLGVPGSALPNHLDIIATRHRELDSPRFYVFVFYMGNDFTDMMKYYEKQLKEKLSDDDKNWSDFITKSNLVQRSYLAQFISKSSFNASDSDGSQDDEKSKRKSRLFRAPGGQRIASSIYLLMSGSRTYRLEALKALDRSLNRLKDLSRKLNFQPIFIVIPDKHQTDSGLFAKQASVYNLSLSELDPLLPNRILEERLETYGIKYVDVFSCLKDRKNLYYKIDDHLTASGHRAVAECISKNPILESSSSTDSL